MARIAGKEIPNHKQVWVSLTYIYGIGRNTSLRLLKLAGIEPQKKTADLSDDELSKIREAIEKNIKVEGELRTEVAMNIKRLIDIGSYRGLRHKHRLPVRGQRTKTNARSWKGARGNTIKKK